MKVLHICSDFSKQSIYNQLVSHLSVAEIEQVVYVPTRTQNELGKNQKENLTNVNYKYSFILNKIDRINYFGKIKKIEKDLTSSIDVKNCDVIHAHFLFSDGGVAYNLHKKYGTPYIVAIRNTDINIFFKYFLHLHCFAFDILKNASQIIFLTPKYYEYTFEKYILQKFHEDFIKKTSIIPNGVNPFWLNNINKRDVSFKKNKVTFLYVGDFSKNKNIQVSIQALGEMYGEGKNIQFVIVGGGGNYDTEIRKLVVKHSNWIKIVERTNNLEELREIYKSADIFIMPSKYETFGLVYIEAMSQGLPIIYSSGQGVDGFFEEGEVGFSVKSGKVLDLKEKLDLMIDNYENISTKCCAKSKDFSWVDISKKYIDIYNRFSKSITNLNNSN
jgi:glycosyltransferase involved in cell wall biosynthesis